MLLHLPFSPNLITLLGIATGLLSSVLLGLGHLIAGIVALQSSILLDFCDGEVSRYRKQQSKEGSYLDRVYHFSVHPSIFAGVTVAAYRARPSLWVVVVGFVCTISVFVYVMVMAYANELAVWKHSRKLVDRLNAALDADPAQRSVLTEMLTPRPLQTTSTISDDALHNNIKQSGFARRVSEMAAFWDFPYIFWVVTVGAVSQVFVPLVTVGTFALTPLEMVLLFYAMTYPCWIALFLFYVLATQSTERGYLGFADDLSLLLSRTSRTTTDESGG